MENLEEIYMADDAISGADVYKPITDWAGKKIAPAVDWTVEKLNQPFKPLVNIEPAGFAHDNSQYPGFKTVAALNDDSYSVAEDMCRRLTPRIKQRDEGGMASMSPRTFSGKMGLFGTTDEPCLKEQGQENFNKDFKRTMSAGADWLNQGGAAQESSMNPLEDRNWKDLPSMKMGHTYEPRPARRDYGVRQNQAFSVDQTYKPGLAKDLADQLSDPVYGPAGQSIADDLKKQHLSTYMAVNGKDVWNRLKSDFGVDQAAQIIKKLGYFSGVRGNATFSGNEIFNFTQSEAEKAMQQLETENRQSQLPQNTAADRQEFSLHPDYEQYGYDYEAAPDPRQYGVPKSSQFSTGLTYTPELAEDVSRILSDPQYGDAAQDIAALMRHQNVGNHQPVSGRELYDGLARKLGPQRAREVIRRLDYFSGIKADGYAPSSYPEKDEEAFETQPGEGYPTLFR